MKNYLKYKKQVVEKRRKHKEEINKTEKSVKYVREVEEKLKWREEK